MAIWESDKGTFLRVVVRPNSKEKQFCSQYNDSEIVLNLRSPARGGRANTELVKSLAKMLSISTSNLSVVKGHKVKEKVVLVVGMNRDEIVRHFLELINDK